MLACARGEGARAAVAGALAAIAGAGPQSAMSATPERSARRAPRRRPLAAVTTNASPKWNCEVGAVSSPHLTIENKDFQSKERVSKPVVRRVQNDVQKSDVWVESASLRCLRARR